MLGVGVDLADLDAAPNVRAGDIDGGVLPGPAPSPTQPADVEAIDLNEISWLFNIEVQRLALGRCLPFRLGRIASDQAQPLDASAEPVPAQDLEHPAG